MYKLVLVFCYGMLMVACASAPYQSSNKSLVKMGEKSVDLNNSNRLKKILNQQYKDWHNVPHRMGGLSKDGIDCSGLVYLTYRSKFGVDMPRSTELQSKVGYQVNQSQLRAGDLLFFKTGIKVRHVGMYIDEGNFLHASSSKGVMISNIKNPYWSSAYWKARRIK